MSEITAAPVTPKRSRTRIFVTIISVLLLLLIYGAGFVALPISILTNYQHKNCDSVLSLNNLYTSIYPGFIQDDSFSSQVKECEAYVIATSNEEDGIWQDAYGAYQSYASKYPNGLFAKEAHEHSAIVLMNIARDQDSQKQYDEAMKNLGLITSSYSDTSVSADAWELIPSTYTSWGTGLRDAGDFEKSEQVFTEFKDWVGTNQKHEFAKDVNSELAKTYVGWGQNLQTQGQFKDALAKYEMAIPFDPEHAKASQRKAYVEWGNDLLKKNDLSAAMEKFEKAVSLADGGNDDGARDALANGHIQWAASLTKDEDFFGALNHLEIAKKTAVSDATKKSVDTAFSGTYVYFSMSGGLQAKQAMEDAAKTVCEKNQKPELPIFGLSKDLVRVGLYGLDVELPESLGAKTPAEMHYVACIDQEKKTIDSRYVVYGLPKPPGGSYIPKKLGNTYIVGVQEYRIQFIWNVSLRKINEIGDIATSSIPGGAPPRYPTDWGAVGDGYLYGEPPDALILIQWLQSHLD